MVARNAMTIAVCTLLKAVGNAIVVVIKTAMIVALEIKVTTEVNEVMELQ